MSARGEDRGRDDVTMAAHYVMPVVLPKSGIGPEPRPD